MYSVFIMLLSSMLSIIIWFDFRCKWIVWGIGVWDRGKCIVGYFRVDWVVWVWGCWYVV